MRWIEFGFCRGSLSQGSLGGLVGPLEKNYVWVVLVALPPSVVARCGVMCSRRFALRSCSRVASVLLLSCRSLRDSSQSLPYLPTSTSICICISVSACSSVVLSVCKSGSLPPPCLFLSTPFIYSWTCASLIGQLPMLRPPVLC